MSLFNGLRPFGVKKSPSSRLACQVACETCSAFASPTWTLGNLRISIRGKYTEGSRISQGFVCCNPAPQPKTIAPSMAWRRRGSKQRIAGDRRLWVRIFRGVSRGSLAIAAAPSRRGRHAGPAVDRLQGELTDRRPIDRSPLGVVDGVTVCVPDIRLPDRSWRELTRRGYQRRRSDLLRPNYKASCRLRLRPPRLTIADESKPCEPHEQHRPG